MEFRRIPAKGRTPEGYRLATVEETRKYQKMLLSEGILESSEARVLDGYARDARKPQVDVDDATVGIPTHMIVRGQDPMYVPRIPGLLRKELYSEISLDDEGRETALHLSFWSQDIEVIYWLLVIPATSSKRDLKEEWLSQSKKDNSDIFTKLVKWLLCESGAIGEDKVDIKGDEVREAVNFALHVNLEIGANYAIVIVEIIWSICSKKKTKDLIYSEIDRVAVSDKEHTVVLAKLLSECPHEQLARWNGIIRFHFGKLFLEAVGRGYISLVNYLFKLSDTDKDKLLREVYDEGKTLLHYAAEWEARESEHSKPSDVEVDTVSKALFEAFEDDLARKLDNHGRTVLHIASLSGRDKFCKFLVNKYKFENFVDEWGQNFLHYAAQGKNGSRIVDNSQEKLVQGSVLVSCRNKKGETPLHQAAKYGRTDMINSLQLWCKAVLTKTLKQTDYQGQTPLHLAARYGHLETVEMLLKHGSDPLEERDISGRTAIHHVVANTSLKTKEAEELIEALLNHLKTDEQKALLLWASAIGIGTADETEGSGISDIVAFLKEKKKSVKNINILKEAALEGNSRLMWELLNRGADITRILSDQNLSWVSTQVEKFSEQATDQPTIRDTLGRHALAECIAAHFLNPYIKSPITVCITGRSGMGKTSLLNSIEAELLVTAAHLAFPKLWKYEDFDGAKILKLSENGKRMCFKIQKGIANLLAKGKSREYKDKISRSPSRAINEESLVYFLEKYRPEYKVVYKYLACMDFNQLLNKDEEDSAYESQGQSLGAVPRILTVNFNAGNYRGRNEAWAGLAVEITEAIEASMTRAQWLSTCWRNGWRRNSHNFYMQFIFPCLVLVFLAVWMVWAAWLFLEGSKNSQLKTLKYGSIPATSISILWYAFTKTISVFKPVSKQLSGYFSLTDHSDQLGYQQKVISDIMFLKEEIGKEPYTIFSWWCQWEDNVEGTPVPKYGSAPEDKLRIIAFVDDLDHCEDEVILRVLWAINLVFRVCKINVILTMDKNTIETTLKVFSKNQDEDFVDKFISKIIQLPVSLADPADDEWEIFIKKELGHEPNLNKYPVKDEGDPSEANDKTNPSATEDQGHTVKRRNDVESGNGIERCIPSSSSLLTQWLERHPFSFTKFLRWIRGFVCTREGEGEPNEKSPTSALLLKRIRDVREALMQSYSEEEVQTFDKLRVFATGVQKLPREWKCYINYHKFARNVINKKPKNTGKHPPAWRVEFVAWTFVCSQWKREINILIKDWHSYIDVEDKNRKVKREPSLREIVANYIKQRRQADSNNEEEKEQAYSHEEKKKLYKAGQADSTKEKEKEQERWISLYTALDEVQDVSMEGIQCFQDFRFHCVSRYLTLPLQYCKSHEFNKSRTRARNFSQLGSQ